MLTIKDTFSAMRVKQNIWNLEEVLPLSYTLPPQYWEQAPPDVIDNFTNLLSRDVYSEGDSQSLYDYIVERQEEMSPAFLAMMELWLADELKHYEALRRTYHCISGMGFAAMDQQFSARVHEIEPIQMVLQDEFTLLVTLMFDEIGSVYSYRRDLQEYYRHFGTPIQKIGHHLIKDEGMHFNNAAELLLTQHRHRLGEVAELLKQISWLEKAYKSIIKLFFSIMPRNNTDFRSILIQLLFG
jgi:hypothetical protein